MFLSDRPLTPARGRARRTRDPGRRGGTEGHPRRAYPQHRRGDQGGPLAHPEGQQLVIALALRFLRAPRHICSARYWVTWANICCKYTPPFLNLVRGRVPPYMPHITSPAICDLRFATRCPGPCVCLRPSRAQDQHGVSEYPNMTDRRRAGARAPRHRVQPEPVGTAGTRLPKVPGCFFRRDAENSAKVQLANRQARTPASRPLGPCPPCFPCNSTLCLVTARITRTPERRG